MNNLYQKNIYLKGLLHFTLVPTLVSVNVFKNATKAAYSVSVKFSRTGFPLSQKKAPTLIKVSIDQGHELTPCKKPLKTNTQHFIIRKTFVLLVKI
ncbi:MAG: hypothetical protein GW772_12285 [Flavobacteriia bacterium]|nr:hypothetical protein [Flavobacteriia bacterium]OIP45147.1 MAG: hypothetical protein AUK46_13585 [Flavobacteriaceae bacterium CG2_30_31_66]PIV97706.1 MAG: hypothetical protein COW43_01700 [Flavobacteriaceae bacterium CG17_big_fil_post_rev_8_21_14_2_50_31_13]PIX13471.1 MAG: hypothetical protein COZ74_06130 [Flavobacteriaceae bacterium CG_4_8_14_3_um_filter_31_8]PIY15934.1 MAG: hypothetical protein COZ16_02120 [Flavobacteriaceae bacterium CG_4_10_14_3_um_filter_31_253]